MSIKTPSAVDILTANEDDVEHDERRPQMTRSIVGCARDKDAAASCCRGRILLLKWKFYLMERPDGMTSGPYYVTVATLKRGQMMR